MDGQYAPISLYKEIAGKIDRLGSFIGDLQFHPEDLNTIISGLTREQTLDTMGGRFFGIPYRTHDLIPRGKVAVLIEGECVAVWDLWEGEPK